MSGQNLTLLLDYYELTMMQGYYLAGSAERPAVFDLFYRRNPNGNGYSVAAGLEQAIEYVKNLRFTEDDIGYLRKQGLFRDEFLRYLSGFKFDGEIYAVPEGTVVYPNEPLIRVRANMACAQILETALLNIINHQCLIATKSARVVYAAQGDSVLEFGLRRAQGPDAGLYGARAAIIGGCSATSNVLAGQMFDVPIRGTHAHSWVMSFPDELTAFREYVKLYPSSCILLVDTYNTLKSGVPNAITVFNEMKEQGIELKNYGIRIDSGDLAYISKKSREMLDEAGFETAFISASGDLDEHLIAALKAQDAKISLWGVGTNLITSRDCPAFGGVYKLAAQLENGEWVPKIKLSDNPEKITDPGIKKIVRLYDKQTGKIKADLITLEHETIDTSQSLTIFDPLATWKRMTLKPGEYTARELLVPIFIDGECVYKSPSVMEIREYCKQEMETLWDEHKRLINPQVMPVDLSLELYNLKERMLNLYTDN
jgi:nicotinate phosphoribosyltransferase